MSWVWAVPAGVVVLGALLVAARATRVVDDARAVVRSVESFRQLRGELALLRVERDEAADRLRSLRRQ
jgi:hypothetical protein